MMDKSGYNQTDLKILNDLIEAGKKGELWTLTIVFSLDGETKTVYHRNKHRAEIMSVRREIFLSGFIHPIGVNSWRIICPLDISAVYLDRQSGYFNG